MWSKQKLHECLEEQEEKQTWRDHCHQKHISAWMTFSSSESTHANKTDAKIETFKVLLNTNNPMHSGSLTEAARWQRLPRLHHCQCKQVQTKARMFLEALKCGLTALALPQSETTTELPIQSKHWQKGGSFSAPFWSLSPGRKSSKLLILIKIQLLQL